MSEIGLDKHRKEAWQKVTGEAKYTDDMPDAGLLHARIAVSPHAHARIVSIDVSGALAVAGVKLVLTGGDCPVLSGPLVRDRPLLARDIVRYAGEPVALVVAQNEAAAALATEQIRVTYKVLPFVLDPYTSFTTGTPLLHQELASYVCSAGDVYPQAGTNILSHYPIRKGDMNSGWGKCEHIISREFNLPPSGHIAMEPRTARAQIEHDGTVNITASSQSPYEVVQQISDCFSIPAGNIRVRVPFVGGGFGGKAPVTAELLAYLASSKLGGRAVRMIITRHEDMASFPCRIGLWAKVKLGADRNGIIHAAQLQYVLDGGAYADINPYMAKAAAANCTGPYNIENLHCDAYSVYTNRTYATSFRGYAHESFTFCIERSMDALASSLSADPFELRRINAIRPGNLSPTQVMVSLSNAGNLEDCIDSLRTLGSWNGGAVERLSEYKVRAKGCACFWKSPTPPIDAVSGAVVTANSDGSFNLSTGVVEMGNGSKSLLTQMLADRLGITAEEVHTDLAVDTRLNPEHYKTVASFSAYMAGRAVMRAADDVITQIRRNAAPPLGCSPEDVELGGGRAFVRQEPERFLPLKDVLTGYTQMGATGEPVIGRGGFLLKGITALDTITGKGRTAPAWTLGAQIVEIELDERDCSYRILNAYTVMDVGKVLNRAEQIGMVKGGMDMGLSLASREVFRYENGSLATPSLRSYKITHFSEHPKYHAAFVETPQTDAPYGSRPMSEHSIIGMPAALANALSAAAGVEVNTLPVTPETLWCIRNKGAV